MKKIVLVAIAVSTLMGFTKAPSVEVTVLKDDEKAANQAIFYRTSLMQTIKLNALSMRRIAGGHLDQKDNYDELASIVVAAISMADDAFAMDTRGKGEAKTTAQPDIWAEGSDFKARLKSFEADAKALEAAAMGDDVEGSKKALAKFFTNCKSCHDVYRTK